MKRSALISAAVLFLLLAAAGVVRQQPDRALTPTTYGTGPRGYKALHDLLRESDVPAARNLARLSALPAGTTVWFIEPQSLCRGDGEEDAWDGDEWLQAGGTAVVFLAPEQKCPGIAGEALPGLVALELQPPDAADGAGGEEGDTSGERGSAAPGGPGAARPTVLLGGPRLLHPRPLAFTDLHVFAEPGSWTTGAAPADGRPFILERSVGGGRLVVVADARFLSNHSLAEADSGPLAMDLVRAYGAPLFDERDHGFRAAEGMAGYRGFTAALPAFAALAITGLAFVWWGAALPPPLARSGEPPAPTLATYVQSLATLYARSGDAAGAAQRYRDYSTSQLRRHLGLPPDAPLETVISRLERLDGIGDAELALLRRPPAVGTEDELRQQARALDDLLRKATR